VVEFLKVFERILVISLPESEKRRVAVCKQLRNSRFSFIDAFNGDSDQVKRAYLENRVFPSSVCFRCRGVCEKSHNNLLLPSQVATWLSHKKALQSVVEASGDNGNFALVLEDDFKILTHAKSHQASERLTSAIRSELSSNLPKLIKLCTYSSRRGSPNTPPVAVSNLRSMSNPAYAVNKLAANLLLEKWPSTFHHTVDVWIHQEMAGLLNATRINPPPITEKSHSTVFRFEPSTIHPKKPAIGRLLSGRIGPVAFVQQRKAHSEHISRVTDFEILCTGHPRTGSKFMSALLCRGTDFEVGHEKMLRHGISSWMFAGNSWEVPYGNGLFAKHPRFSRFKTVLNFVRNPEDALPSIIREFRYAEHSFNFIQRELLVRFGIDLNSLSNESDRAVTSLRLWNAAVHEKFPDAKVVRIESALQDLNQAGLEARIDLPELEALSQTNKDKKYNGKHFLKEPRADAISALSPRGLAELSAFSKEFGY
jgi:GR25 family glycosyltransferase involved in LPS biosynthesis